MGVLMDNPATMLAASARGWSHPFSREAALAADLWDVEVRKGGGKKSVVYPRPWDKADKKLRRGNAAGRSNAQVLALVRP